MTEPRVAIAHDYLTQRGGAERVVLSLLKAFPRATVYTTLYDPEGTFPEFRDVHVATSPLNRVKAFRQDHRKALPFLASASNSLRIDGDIVVASSTGWAHGFPTQAPKLVYCHSPARYLYLTDEYLGKSAKSTAKGLALLGLRPGLIRWDQRAARSASKYLCNSTVVRERIQQVYGLDAEVVPPPAGVIPGGPQAPIESLKDWADEGWHLVVSRLMPYKNVQHVVEAFRGIPEKLVIVGRGPMRESLQAQLPSNVRMLEGLSDEALRWVYAHSRGLVAASHEDFGLTPLEAGIFGKPCTALRAGGYLDTIEEGTNGTFFDKPSPALIRQAIQDNRGIEWPAERIQRHVEQFSEARFIERMRREVSALVS